MSEPDWADKLAEEILPCPFCGGNSIVDRTLRDGCIDGEPDAWAYFVRCFSCACQGPWTKNSSGAQRLWNNRPMFAQALRQTRLRALEEALDLIARTTTPRSDLYMFIQAEKK